MSSSERYSLRSPVESRPGTFHAVDTVTGQKLYLHVLRKESQGELIQRVHQSRSAPGVAQSGDILDVIEDDATYSVVTEAIPRCEDLTAWAAELDTLDDHEPGEFTRIFGSAQSEEPKSEHAPETPKREGEFTRLFESGPSSEPAQSAPPGDEPSSVDAAKAPGEFTRLFDSGKVDEPTNVDSPASPTQSTDDIESTPEPAAGAGAREAQPLNDVPTPKSQGQDQVAPSVGKEAGEVTQFFRPGEYGGTADGDVGSAPEGTPPAVDLPSSNVARRSFSQPADEFDSLFGPEQPQSEAPETPQPPSRGSEPEPGGFTQLFSQHQAREGGRSKQKPPDMPNPQRWGDSKEGDSGGLTQLFRKGTPHSESPYARSPGLDATRVFDSGSRPVESTPGPQMVGEGEYTRIIETPGAQMPPPPGLTPPDQAVQPSAGDADARKKRKPNIFLILALVFVMLLLVVLGAAWLINEFRSPGPADQPAAAEIESEPATGGGSQGVRIPSRAPNVRGPSVRGPSVQGGSVRAPTVRGPRVSGARIPATGAQSSTSETQEVPATNGGGRSYLIIIAVLGVLLLAAIGTVAFLLLRR